MDWKQVKAARGLLWLLAVACALATLQPVAAQPAARRQDGVDLGARLKALEADPALRAGMVRTGRKVAAVCTHCHGEGGNSVSPDVPNLAGQNPEYLIEQLRQFAEGRRRNEFMEGMIRALSADEKVGIVVFYAGERVSRKPVANAALAVRGRDYYQKVCFQCHGADGRGNEHHARIAGQQPAYLRLTLLHYRQGAGTRVNPIMSGVTRPMSDADIEAVVAYVSSMD